MNQSEELDIFISVLNKYEVLETVQVSKTDGWEAVWKKFDEKCNSEEFADVVEKRIYIDLFLHQCLSTICPVEQSEILFQIMEKWFHYRKPDGRCGHIKQNEKISMIHFLVKLRTHLLDYLTKKLSQVSDVCLTEERQRVLIALWRQAFFEPFSALCLYWNPPQKEQADLKEKFLANGFHGLAAASMYLPFNADDYNINIEDLLDAQIPDGIKTILMLWMVNTPYFHGTEKHRDKLLRYVPPLCRALMKNPRIVKTFFFFLFVQEVMTGLWRASYIGGNTLAALNAFGDFIAFVMQRSFPVPTPERVVKILENGEKIRIGYISRNFYKQAVSLYMVNRVVYHDRDKFEVCIFALGEYHDDISEMFKQNCDHFERLTQMSDLRAIAQSIIDQHLDILVYADIGMDPVTYMLSGLQLAPVQCALVGHGTSTGMPTVQYYISGDFEAKGADAHYREKLIRLPKLGAAQYMPMKPEIYLSREKLGIPEDAVVFISCANGLKHGKPRYPLFIDILAKASNAWILLKPYAHPSGIDYNFAGEILSLAVQAGVEGRIKILPPMGEAKHVLGLLSISDVQLDSYPYGGWTTNMEALYMGLPIVSQEGELARSRWGAGMLRALGISEGIAANEEEYVAWAVKLAQDENLRKELKTRIKRRVKRAFFNGPYAQRAYEDALIKIANEPVVAKSKAKAAEITYSPDTPVIVTSLTPGAEKGQIPAMVTWQQAGFKVVSLNRQEDIAALQSCCTGIEFVAVQDNIKQVNGRAYIYFDDILQYFRLQNIAVCGIVNPGVYLAKPELQGLIRKEAPGAIVYGSQVDVESLTELKGSQDNQGFHFFFFDRELIQYYQQKKEFCLGLPWLDYWTVLVPLMRGYPAKKLTTPVAVHVRHKINWDKKVWLELGNNMAENFKPPFTLTDETMPKYAMETLTIINKLSTTICLDNASG